MTRSRTNHGGSRPGRAAPAARPREVRRAGAMTPIAKAVCRALIVWAAVAAWPAQSMGILVPPYFHPVTATGDWDRLAAIASRVPTVAIVNPDSGPGSDSDPGYVDAIRKLRDAGGKVIGYVSTRYGQRPLQDVVADILRYRSFYQLDGFFIDEMSTDDDMARVQYYQSIYVYIKALGADYRVVGNPGTNTKEIYLSLPAADTVVVFEGDPAAFADYAPDEWMSRYDAERFAYLLHGTVAAQMNDVARKAADYNAGYLYVTDDTLPNPWDGLPSYWDQEVSIIARIAGPAKPTVRPDRHRPPRRSRQRAPESADALPSRSR